MFDIAHTHSSTLLRANVPQITTSMLCHNETLKREYLGNRLHDDRQWKSDNAKKRESFQRNCENTFHSLCTELYIGSPHTMTVWT